MSARQWRKLNPCGKQGHILRRAKKALLECQKTEKLLFSKAAFERLVKEIMDGYKAGMRIGPKALDALAEASTSVVTTFFEDCQEAALHASRQTVMPKDAKYVRRQWVKQDERIEATRRN